MLKRYRASQTALQVVGLYLSCALLTGCPNSAAAAPRFPADSGIVDVTKEPYNVDATGKTDVTAEIQQAIFDHIQQEKHGASYTLYFPSGTYLVSGTLDWLTRTGATGCFLGFSGEDEKRTVFKLHDSCAGFMDPANPRPVIQTHTQGTGADAYGNYLSRFTVDVGTGNPGAVGLNYNVNNYGAVEDVTVKAGPGSGRYGVESSLEDGPGELQRVSVQGFDIGVYLTNTNTSLMFEDLSLRGQRIAGIVLEQSAFLAIRHLKSSNTVPALVVRGTGDDWMWPLVTLTDSQLTNGDAHTSAITSDDGRGRLLLQNIQTSGYQSALTVRHQVLFRKSVPFYTSDTPLRLFSSVRPAFSLSVAETPNVPTDPASAWVNVQKFGAKTDAQQENYDSTAAIQKAIDSGATTVYFPTGVYRTNGTIHLRGRVRRVVGMDSNLIPMIGNTAFGDADHPQAMLEFDNGSAPVVVVEHLSEFSWNHGDIEDKGLIELWDRTRRTLVFKHAALWALHPTAAYRNTANAGTLFVEDVSSIDVGKPNTPPHWQFLFPQTAFLRYFNPEEGPSQIPNDVLVDNNGGHLWIFGMKTEAHSSTIIRTRGGGITELLGGWTFINNPEMPDLPAFICDNSEMTVNWRQSTYMNPSKAFGTLVRETRGQESRELEHNSADTLNDNPLINLYIGGVKK